MYRPTQEDPASNRPRPDACPLCHGRHLSLWFVDGTGDWAAYGCPDCDLWFVWPPESGASDDPTGVNYFNSDGYMETVSRAYVAHKDPLIARFKRILRRATRHRPPGLALGQLRAADVGCGVGTSVEAMGQLGIQAVGCDYSAGLIDYARRVYPSREYRVGSVDALEDGTFDLVSAYNLIEHVSDLHGLTEGFARKLRPGGLLLLETPDRYSLFQHVLVVARQLGVPFSTLSQDGGHVYLFSRRSLAALMAAKGLDVVDTWTVMSPVGELFSKNRERQGRLAAMALPPIYLLSLLSGRRNRIILVARKRG